MGTYRVPVLPQSESDRPMYYSWHDSPESRVLLNQPYPAVPPHSIEDPNNRHQKRGVDTKVDCTVTSSIDAKSALDHIAKGTAKGDICALTFRLWLQTRLFNLGCVIESHRWTVLVVGCIVLGLCCLGLKTVRLENDVENLWVQDSGRISRELDYTRRMLGKRSSASSIEALLQTGQNLLDPTSLQHHLDLIQKARETSVRIGTRKWTFDKICQKISLGSISDLSPLSSTINEMTPCLIITPLDCFWDGAKVLGPSQPVKLHELNMDITWSNFDPQRIFNQLKSSQATRATRTLVDRMSENFREMGTLRGYQDRPCLEPQDKEKCVNHGRPTDVGEILRGGCNGFASNFMHWPEPLIVGGAEHSKDGSRLTRIRALQTLLFLRSPHELYDEVRNSGQYHFEWSLEQAKHIIRSWQKEMRKRVAEMDVNAQAKSKAPGATIHATEHVYAFTDSSLKDLLTETTNHVNPVVLGGGAFLVAFFLTVCFVRWKEPISSHVWVALVSFVICALTIVAGLGFSAVLGLTFNVLTVKVLPFLLLGIAMDDCFRLTKRFDQILKNMDVKTNSKLVIGETLKTAGPPLLLASFSNIVAIFAGAFIPVPVMQMFCLQAGLVCCLQLLTSLLLLPALLSLDLQRRRGYRVDCLCCLANRPENPITLGGNPPVPQLNGKKSRRSSPFSPRNVIRRGIVPAIRLVPVKAFVVTVAAVAIGASSYGALHFSYGIDFASVVPRSSPEYNFVKSHHELLGVYNFYVSTGHEFDYAKDQLVLRRYYEALRRVPEVMTSSFVEETLGVRNSTATGTSRRQKPRPSMDFWLDSMRDWLLDVQSAFDKDKSLGHISDKGRWTTNVTHKGLVGLLLIIQTGKTKNAVEIDRIKKGRLVNSKGIIDPDAFYVYLTAWRSLCSIQYEVLRNLLRPHPSISNIVLYKDQPESYKFFLKSSIEKSRPIEFTQINFFLRNVQDSATMLRVVKEIREITDKFTAAGLPNYPSGIPFIFFEQYFHLTKALTLAIGVAFGTIIVILFFFFFNFLILLVGVGMLFITLAEVCGLCSLLSLYLNGASAVVLITCVGLFSRYQSSILWTFLISRGNRQRRSERALIQHGPTIFHACIAMLLALAVLAASPLDFIVTYFFKIISLAVLLSLLNTLILLPSVLALTGPASQFRPATGWGSSTTTLHEGHLPSDRPDLDDDPGLDRTSLRQNSMSVRTRPVSLSTISEEPSRLSSSSSLDKVSPQPPPHPPPLPPHHQIRPQPSHHQTQPSVVLVEPEIVVQTNSSQDQRCSHPLSGRSHQAHGPNQMCCHEQPGGQVTTVKATAKFKVEVHSSSPLTNTSNSVFAGSPCSDSGSSSSSSSSDNCSYVHRCSSDTNFLPDRRGTGRSQSVRTQQEQQQHYPLSVHHYSTQHKPKHHHRHHHHHQSQRGQVYSHSKRRDRARDLDDESGIDTCEE